MHKAIFVGLLIASGPIAAETWNDGDGTTWDCAKDSTGTINAGAGTYVFKGACTSITVNGSSNKVTIERAERVAVNGNRNTVTIVASDAVITNGNDNKVSVAKALTRDKTKIADPGSRNTITTGAAAATKAADKPADKRNDKPTDKPAAPDKPAADKPAATSDAAIAIDCAKSPAYSIPSGRGSYKFTGTCDKIALAGGENVLSIEAVKELAITGSSNTIEIGAADRIAAVGANNKVTFKKGLSGAKPKVSSVGTNNKIEQVK